MEYDKAKVFTALNADEVKVGSKGYFADNIRILKETIKETLKDSCAADYGEIDEIKDDSCACRFSIKKNSAYTFFYLVEEPKEKELRPYTDTDEMIDHFCRHFNLIPQDYRLPTLWVKNDNRKYLITRVSENTVTLCFENDVFTFSLRILLDDYTWLDGSLCGIEE